MNLGDIKNWQAEMKELLYEYDYAESNWKPCRGNMETKEEFLDYMSEMWELTAAKGIHDLGTVESEERTIAVTGMSKRSVANAELIAFLLNNALFTMGTVSELLESRKAREQACMELINEVKATGTCTEHVLNTAMAFFGMCPTLGERQ